MNITPFRALLPNKSLIHNQEFFFNTVKENFNQFRSQDYFSAVQQPAFYILRIACHHLEATGFVCTTAVEDYIEERILKHEITIYEKQQLQIDLLKERNAAVKPTVVLHQEVPEIQHWLMHFAQHHTPVLQFEFAPREKHVLWKIGKEEDMLQIQQLFQSKIEWAAIADGHHRFSSFATLWNESLPGKREKYARVLSAYFPENALEIGTFHRIVSLPKNRDTTEILQKISELGTLRKMDHPTLPTGKHQMGIFLPSGKYYFEWDRSFVETGDFKLPALDAHLLFQHILNPILQIKDLQTETNVQYIEGDNGVEKIIAALHALPNGIGFALFPIHTKDFFQLAQLNAYLVPKITQFLPRLKNGLIIQQID